MKKRYKAIIREMLQKKWQYGGTSLLIFLAVLLYVMLSASISAVEQSNLDFKAEYNQEDFHFYTSGPLNSDELTNFENKEQVILEMRISSDASLSGEKSLRIFNLPNVINKPFVSKGKLPAKENELALSAVFAKENKIDVGESIDFANRKWKVTGLIYIPDYVYSLKNETDLVNDSKSFGVGLTTEKNLEDIGGQTVYYVGKWKDSQKKLAQLKSDITSLSPIIKWTNAKENPRISYIDTEIQGTKSFTSTLPLFIAVIAMMMVVILIRRRLDTQRKQIGTQLALGYRPKELIKAYLLYPMIVSLAGSLVGIAAGLGLSIPLTNYYTFFFNLPVLSRWGINPLLLIGALAVPLILLTSAGYWVIRKQVIQSPIQL